MKKFSLPCSFNGQVSPFVVYVGEPKKDAHPLQNQSSWLSKERGGVISAVIMSSLDKLHKLSQKNHVSFEELCVYAVTLGKRSGGADDNSSGGSGYESSDESSDHYSDVNKEESNIHKSDGNDNSFNEDE
ncbi:hypothetical protein CAXC1_260040 [Candidatus Xenohaliotis californiensis]|uniref:Uncharacterized protein n=1 Tax=Candidatus Xenohaliotis californiensis TaxID=84677 RepID=A0ABP0EW46_9RICK|nr:hypothetical protein CAXC1_260040 [Candidatus Xenohaliotis californiensis]